MEKTRIEWATEFAETGRGIAEHMGHGEFIPTLLVLDENDNGTIVAMMGVPTGYMYEAVQRVLSEYKFEPKILALTCDAYSDKKEMDGLSTKEEIEEHLRNRVPLAVRFAEGDLNVTECLNTLVMYPDGESVTVNQEYKWTPVDGWEWAEPRILDGATTDWEWDRLVGGIPRREMHELLESE